MSVETEVAQGAATVLTVADALPAIAMAETLGSMAEIPAASLCLMQMIDGAALPGGLGSAALKWAQAGEKLDEAKQKLKDVTAAIPSDAWSSDDREAFNKKIEELGTQLETARIFADAVGTALIVSGGVLAAYDLFISVIGTELLVQAVMIAIEEASVVGDFGPAEAQLVEANATAVELAKDIEGTNKTLQTVARVTAGILTLAGFVHEAVQVGEGNHNALLDSLKGSAVALPEIGLSALLGKGAEKGVGKLLGKVFGKDLDKVGEKAVEEAGKALKDSGVAKDAARDSLALADRAIKAADHDVTHGAEHAATQVRGAANLLEEAGRMGEKATHAGEHAIAKGAEATQKQIDGFEQHVVKKAAEKAGEYGGQHGGEKGGTWIDKILNGE